MATKLQCQLEPWSQLPAKIVLVTGASSGLGLEFCIDLAKAGCRIVAAARRVERLESLCDEINKIHCPNVSGVASDGSPRAIPVALDVKGDGPAIERAWTAFGHVDMLINNAGVRGSVLMIQSLLSTLILIFSTSHAYWPDDILYLKFCVSNNNFYQLISILY